jgi:hypothetical protein
VHLVENGLRCEGRGDDAPPRAHFVTGESLLGHGRNVRQLGMRDGEVTASARTRCDFTKGTAKKNVPICIVIWPPITSVTTCAGPR